MTATYYGNCKNAIGLLLVAGLYQYSQQEKNDAVYHVADCPECRAKFFALGERTRRTVAAMSDCRPIFAAAEAADYAEDLANNRPM